MEYYRATISRDGMVHDFSVRLESKRFTSGRSKWCLLIKKPASSVNHGLDVAEQMRLARDATEYAFEVIVDCR